MPIAFEGPMVGSHRLNLAIEPTDNQEVRKYYEDCLVYAGYGPHGGGACNAHAGLRFLVGAVDRLGGIDVVNLNNDPGARLVMAHIASLLGLDGIGGFQGDLEHHNNTVKLCQKLAGMDKNINKENG